MHSILIQFHSRIPPRFNCIERHQHLFSQSLWLPCRPNQSRNIWRSVNIVLLWAVRILDVIVLLYIRFNVHPAIVFTVTQILSVPIAVEPIISVRNVITCPILIPFNWKRVNSADSADVQYFTSSSREVLHWQRWWQWRSVWQFTCSWTLRYKEWPGCSDDLFFVRNVSHGSCLHDLNARFLSGST